MKTKRADFIYKILFIVVGVILSGLLIAWLVSTSQDKKREADMGTQKINDVTSTMADFDFTVFDGAPTRGSAIRDLIKELQRKEVQIAIKVVTLDNVEKNYIYKTNPETGSNDVNLGEASTEKVSSKKSDGGYITPTGNFIGEVLRNKNNEIVCIKFTQQK